MFCCVSFNTVAHTHTHTHTHVALTNSHKTGVIVLILMMFVISLIPSFVPDMRNPSRVP